MKNDPADFETTSLRPKLLAPGTGRSSEARHPTCSPKLFGIILAAAVFILVPTFSPAQVILRPPSPFLGSQFGYSVDISGDVAVVSELRVADPRVHIYERHAGDFNGGRS